MNHLDEGTIHAWLDGELDAVQSRETEAHIAVCPTCSAAVAEARGLIAGASRIMGALDDVPGGVIPRAAAEPWTNAAAALPTRAPAAPARTAARLKARGQWQIARWASGIAAVLIGAVVLSTAHMADRSAEMTQPMSGASVSQEAARGADSVVQPAAPPAAVPAPERAVRTTSVAAAPTAPVTKGAVGAAVSRDLASARNEEVKTEGVAGERVRAVTPAFGEVRATRARTVDTTQLAAKVSGVQVRTTDTARLRTRSVRLGEVVVTSAPADAATMLSDTDVQRFAGCYRFEAPVEIAQQRTPTAGAAANTERRARSVAPAQAPSTAAAENRADFSVRGIAPLIRLDTTLVAGLRRAVRMPADSAIGSWSVVGDSVLVDLGARGVVRLSSVQRVECP